MVYFWIIILFLATSGREEYLSYALATECVHEFAVIVERTIVEDTFY